jgi:putative redox protein
VEKVLAEGRAEWVVGGRALTLKRAFVEDVRTADLGQRIGELGLPLLVMHSPPTTPSTSTNASEIFRAARHPRSFVSLEGSDHLLVARGQARRAARIISAWADQYLAEPELVRARPELRARGAPLDRAVTGRTARPRVSRRAREQHGRAEAEPGRTGAP